ncbi:YheV family putative metal-binding protein [Psychrobacter sp. HD31]|uniref:YheV family putative metal-binding protein n=1 Tax=Psychrobacter sp. HD31 TaxID=3112003 RepID=UPI003DA4CA49
MRYQSTKPKRQFLAGVKCPKCEAMDKIVQIQIFEPEFDEYIECLACGHNERRPTEGEVQQANTHVTNAGIGVVNFNN